jgi:calcium-dependent protein kinase
MELQNSLEFAGIESDNIDFEEIFDACDADRNGTVDFHEFITATTDRKKLITNTKLSNAFHLFD